MVVIYERLIFGATGQPSVTRSCPDSAFRAAGPLSPAWTARASGHAFYQAADPHNLDAHDVHQHGERHRHELSGTVGECRETQELTNNDRTAAIISSSISDRVSNIAVDNGCNPVHKHLEAHRKGSHERQGSIALHFSYSPGDLPACRCGASHRPFAPYP